MRGWMLFHGIVAGTWSAVAEFEQFLALKMQREEIDQKFEELTKSNLGSNKGDTRVNPGSPEGNE